MTEKEFDERIQAAYKRSREEHPVEIPSRDFKTNEELFAAVSAAYMRYTLVIVKDLLKEFLVRSE